MRFCNSAPNFARYAGTSRRRSSRIVVNAAQPDAVAPVRAGDKHLRRRLHHFALADDRPHRVTVRNRLRKHGHIGGHADKSLGAAHPEPQARGDFVEDQDRSVFAAQFRDAGKIPIRGLFRPERFHDDRRHFAAMRIEQFTETAIGGHRFVRRIVGQLNPGPGDAIGDLPLAAKRSTVSISSAQTIGLRRYASMPVARQRSWSLFRALAVIAMIGTFAFFVSRSIRMALVV